MHSFYKPFDPSCTKKFPYLFLNIKYQLISCQVMHVNKRLPDTKLLQHAAFSCVL